MTRLFIRTVASCPRRSSWALRVARLSLVAAAAGLCFGVARVQSQEAAEGARLSARVGVGPGVGVRFITVPEQAGPVELSTKPFPALDLALRAGVQWRRGFLLDVGADYQTSIGLHVASSTLTRATSGTRSLLRASDVRVWVAPGFRAGRSDSSPRLHLIAGWMVRGLQAVGEVVVPAYMLHGPLLRPELTWTFGGGAISLRGGPELAWIMFASHELRDQLGSTGSGFGVGAEVAADFRVTSGLYLSLVYHGMLVRAPSQWDASFKDVGHWLSLRAELRY